MRNAHGSLLRQSDRTRTNHFYYFYPSELVIIQQAVASDGGSIALIAIASPIPVTSRIIFLFPPARDGGMVKRSWLG